MSRQKLAHLLAGLLAVVPPVLILIRWHAYNQGLPPSDTVRYHRMMMYGFMKVKESGFISGLVQTYQYLGAGSSGTMIVPVLSVPFAVLTHGNLLAAVAWFNGSLYFFLLTYVFLLTSEFVSSPMAVVATLYLGTIPYVINSTYSLMMELPLMACSLSFLYHLKMSDYFRKPAHTIAAGLLFSLSICVRPVETMLILFPVAVGVMLIAVRKNYLSRRDVQMSSALAACGVLGMLASIDLGRTEPAVATTYCLLPVLALVLATFLARRKLALSSPFGIVFLLSLSLAASWLIPWGHLFWTWVRNNTVGLGTDLRITHLLAAERTWQRLMGEPFLVLLTTAGIVGLFSRKKMPKPSPYFWLGLSPAVMLIASLLSGNGDRRYRYTPVFLLNMVLVCSLLSGKLRFQKLGFVVVGALAALQLTVAVTKTFEIFPAVAQNATHVADLIFEQVWPPNREIPTKVELAASLVRLLPEGMHDLAIITPNVSHDFNYVMEEDDLLSLIWKSGQDWSMKRDAFDIRPDLNSKSLPGISGRFDYLVVGPRDLGVIKGAQVNPGWEGAGRLAATLVKAVEENRIQDYGFTYFGNLSFKWTDQYQGAFMVLKNSRSVSTRGERWP